MLGYKIQVAFILSFVDVIELFDNLRKVLGNGV